MDPFVGEIRLFAGTFAPVDWALCNGQTLPIRDNDALFSLLGTTFGGDGRTNFAVPNLQMRLAVGQSTNAPPDMADTYPLGSTGGAYEVALAEAHLPTHTHALNATPAPATTVAPGDTAMFAAPPSGYTSYITPTGAPTLVNMDSTALTPAGASLAHHNMMPTLCITYIICTRGLYPDFSN